MFEKLSQFNESLNCQSKAPPEDRPLISMDQALELEGLFKVFCNSTRLRIIHALVRKGELSVTQLAETIEMKPQAVSNQLRRLADRGLLASKRNGNNVHYRIVDPCVTILLVHGICLIEDSK